jgi:hypothetical protein
VSPSRISFPLRGDSKGRRRITISVFIFSAEQCIGSVREPSNLVSSGKFEEDDFRRFEDERVVDECRMSWFLGWKRSQQSFDN